MGENVFPRECGGGRQIVCTLKLRVSARFLSVTRFPNRRLYVEGGSIDTLGKDRRPEHGHVPS